MSLTAAERKNLKRKGSRLLKSFLRVSDPLSDHLHEIKDDPELCIDFAMEIGEAYTVSQKSFSGRALKQLHARLRQILVGETSEQQDKDSD